MNMVFSAGELSVSNVAQLEPGDLIYVPDGSRSIVVLLDGHRHFVPIEGAMKWQIHRLPNDASLPRLRHAGYLIGVNSPPGAFPNSTLLWPFGALIVSSYGCSFYAHATNRISDEACIRVSLLDWSASVDAALVTKDDRYVTSWTLRLVSARRPDESIEIAQSV